MLSRRKIISFDDTYRTGNFFNIAFGGCPVLKKSRVSKKMIDKLLKVII